MILLRIEDDWASPVELAIDIKAGSILATIELGFFSEK